MEIALIHAAGVAPRPIDRSLLPKVNSSTSKESRQGAKVAESYTMIPKNRRDFDTEIVTPSSTVSRSLEPPI